MKTKRPMTRGEAMEFGRGTAFKDVEKMLDIGITNAEEEHQKDCRGLRHAAVLYAFQDLKIQLKSLQEKK